MITGASASAVPAPTESPPEGTPGGVQLEELDRGLVAVDTDDGVFLSWRLLGDEVTGHTETGMDGPDFRVYRDGEDIATVSDSTNFLDEDAGSDAEYSVAALVDGKEQEKSDPVAPWADGYYDLPLQKPEGGVTPAGEEYEYTANDISVGDVTGDGQYEFIVKWDPDNSKDVSQVGYTGNVYIDTYTFDGTLLNRIDLGPNIRAGAHYTQFLVYDFDGDGRAEMMFKTAPGTKTTTYDADGEVVSEEYVTMPEEDREAGYSHDDDYRMSADDYYEHVVEMFMEWHEHPEVEAGNWPATLEEAFDIDPVHDYPLSREAAEDLADHFMDVYAPERSEENELRDFEGFIVDGPEYLTVFDGETGSELETIHYEPERGDDGLLWGDYAMERIEPGNRVDRFLAGVAYLDGTSPSAVFARGYYTRTTMVSYGWDGENITEDWSLDSGHAPMDNPFNDSPHGVEGTDPEHGTMTTQGFHSLSVADVDGDGKQEIIYGAATVDNDGSLLYSSYDYGPPESDVPGEYVKLGHGDAMHVGHFDPQREGMEIWTVHEGATEAPYGFAMRDAASGEVLFGEYTGVDTGRGMVGDIDPDTPGYHAWSSMPPDDVDVDAGLWTADGEYLGTDTPGTNMSIRWSADMTTQIVNGTDTEEGAETPTVDDWQDGTVLTADGTLTNNHTKGNPGLVADVFGDWREELLLRTEDSEAIRIYTSTEVTDRKLYTLMHDPQYRVGVAWQQTVYNQPTYPDFYLGSDIDWSSVPVPEPEYPKG